MFYTFSQNNSGGDFNVDHDRGISQFVIIEADNPDKANERAEEIGLYFDGCDIGYDCDCCGDRWYRVSGYQGSEDPEVYGRNPHGFRSGRDYVPFKWVEGADGYIHYANGEVEAFEG